MVGLGFGVVLACPIPLYDGQTRLFYASLSADFVGIVNAAKSLPAGPGFGRSSMILPMATASKRMPSDAAACASCGKPESGSTSSPSMACESEKASAGWSSDKQCSPYNY